MRRLLVSGAIAAVLLVACTPGDDAASTDTPDSARTDAADDPLDAERYVDAAADVPLAETDAAEPPVLPASAGGATGYSRYVFRDFEGRVLTSLVEGPLGRQVRCQEVELPCSYEDLVDLAASGAEVPDELGLEDAQLAELVDQLDVVRDVVVEHADVNRACRAGYRSDRIQTPNMGSHFTNSAYVADGVFDPERPEILIYAAAGGTRPTADTYGQCVDGVWTGGDVEIVAASFLLPLQRAGEDHPDAFAGGLDNWHVHYNLCRGSGRDTIVPRSECEERGGRWSARLGWMIHAWVAPGFDNQLGVFSMWNPTVWPESDPAAIKEARTATVADAPGGTAFVPIENFSFGTVEAEVGKPVRWTNSDSVPHTVTAGSQAAPDDDFDSGVFAPGESYELSFDEPGEYRFFCALHPDMNGTVVVE